MYPYSHKGLADKNAALNALERNPVARMGSLYGKRCCARSISPRSFLDAKELAPRYAKISLRLGLKLGAPDLHNSQSASAVQGSSRMKSLIFEEIKWCSHLGGSNR